MDADIVLAGIQAIYQVYLEMHVWRKNHYKGEKMKNISYHDENYDGLPFYSLVELGSFDLECTYDPETFAPQHFLINRILVTQENILADLFWEYDVERVRADIRDFDQDKDAEINPEPHTFGNTGCVRRVA